MRGWCKGSGSSRARMVRREQRKEKKSSSPDNAAYGIERNLYFCQPVDMDAPVERDTGMSLVGEQGW